MVSSSKFKARSTLIRGRLLVIDSNLQNLILQLFFFCQFNFLRIARRPIRTFLRRVIIFLLLMVLMVHVALLSLIIIMPIPSAMCIMIVITIPDSSLIVLLIVIHVAVCPFCKVVVFSFATVIVLDFFVIVVLLIFDLLLVL